MAVPGVSTLGIKFGYGTGSTKPTEFRQLHRINSIGEITLESESIDASALEDLVASYVAGRQDTGGGTLDVVINLTDETIAEWEALITEYQALDTGEEIYFETWSPYLTKAFFIKAQPPLIIPQPAADQNGLFTVTITLTITGYIGLDTAVEPQ